MSSSSFDLIVRNGTIVDGTGADRFTADIGISNGRIAGIGNLFVGDAGSVIDASGLIVAPGFIDPHTHYDAQLFWDPTASPSPYHGVTTVLGGFCGFTLAPLEPHATDYLVQMLSRVEDMPLPSLRAGVPCDWRTFEEYSARLEGRLAVNAGFSVGHSTIRRVVMGERAITERANADDLHQMQQLMRQSFSQGALGFSTSHSISHNDHNGSPVPSRLADHDEYVALAGICREYEGTTVEVQPGHAFDEEVFQLLTDMSLAARRTLNWNPTAVRDTSDEQKRQINLRLSMSDFARERGAEVIAMVVPTDMTLHMNLVRGAVFEVLPGWARLFKLSVEDRIARLHDAEFRQSLVEQVRESNSPYKWLLDPDRLMIEQAHSPYSKPFVGMTIEQMSKQIGKPSFDAMIELAVADGLKTLFKTVELGENLETYAYRAQVWRDDRTVIGASDGGAHVETINTFAYFTQMLDRAVRQFGVVTLEEAVQMLTQAPARLMGLRNRGQLTNGWCADIVIFDEDRIAQGPVHMRKDLPAGAERLYADAEGITHVLVNGQLVIDNGSYTGALPGTLLRRGHDTRTVGIPGKKAA